MQSQHYGYALETMMILSKSRNTRTQELRKETEKLDADFKLFISNNAARVEELNSLDLATETEDAVILDYIILVNRITDLSLKYDKATYDVIEHIEVGHMYDLGIVHDDGTIHCGDIDNFRLTVLEINWKEKSVTASLPKENDIQRFHFEHLRKYGLSEGYSSPYVRFGAGTYLFKKGDNIRLRSILIIHATENAIYFSVDEKEPIWLPIIRFYEMFEFFEFVPKDNAIKSSNYHAYNAI